MYPSPEEAAGAIVREGEGDDHQQPPASSIFEVTTQSLNDAAAAISEAGAFVADIAVEIGATGVEMTSDAAAHVAKAGSRLFSGIGLTSAIEYLDDAIDEKAIKDAIVGAAGAVSDRLDQVTGKQLVELLEEKLRRQDEYNDILATRLAEALQRIAALEKKVPQ